MNMASRYLEVTEVLSGGEKLPVLVNLDHVVQIYSWPADERDGEIKVQIVLADSDTLDVVETYEQIRQAIGMVA